MTANEYVKLVKIGDSFHNEIGKIAAKYIVQFPERLENEVIDYLQDKCSIYGTRYEEYLKTERMKKICNNCKHAKMSKYNEVFRHCGIEECRFSQKWSIDGCG